MSLEIAAAEESAMSADAGAETGPTEAIRLVPGDDPSALLPRLRVIEDQPLESRAVAFVQIHDRLQATLEGSVRDGLRDGGVDPSNTHG